MTESITKEEEKINNEEEYLEEGRNKTFENSYRKVKAENENYRQEIHGLRQKLELQEAMLREIQESNDSLEHSFEQRLLEKEKIIQQIEERNRTFKRENEAIIANLGTKVTEVMSENEEMRKLVKQLQEEQSANKVTIADLSVNLDIDTLATKAQFEELTLLLSEEQERRVRAEEVIKELNNRCNEAESLSRIANDRLATKNQELEDIKEELAVVRTEMLSIKLDPTRESSKGNSLFAEVEDRRRADLDKMNALRQKYAEAKRACETKTAEIRQLRAQQTTMLRKWENESFNLPAETQELIRKYQSLIAHLKNELKRQVQTTINEVKCPPEFEYLQSLLQTKKCEVTQLQAKIEDMSVHMLLEEEMKLVIKKELRYWQNKATFLEAQICMIKCELESGHKDNAICNNLKDVISNCVFSSKAALDDGGSDYKPNSLEEKRQHENNSHSPSTNEKETIEDTLKDTKHAVTSLTKPTEKTVRFCTNIINNTTDKEYQPMKRSSKAAKEYPLIYIPTIAQDADHH